MQNLSPTRILLFIGISLFSLWCGLFLINEDFIFYVFIYLGYPNILITFGLFLISLFLLLKRDRHLLEFLPKDKTGWFLIGLAFVLLISFEPFEFKIVYDEPILSTIAQMMHTDRLAGMPREANDFGGSYLLLNSFMDKRPLFFPFLLSIFHDILGYRYQNVFIMNTLLTGVLLVLLYGLGNLLGGRKGGVLAIILTLTLPLLAIFTTSGHFEILNLVMICLLLMLSYSYLDKPAAITLVPLVYCLVLLFQVRYENCLYLLPFGMLILFGWKKAGRIILPWQVLIVPILLIVYVIQYRYSLNESRGFFQEGPNGRVDTFSLSYAWENLDRAVEFFLNAGQSQPNSYLLLVFGLSAIIFLCVYATRNWKGVFGSESKGKVMLAFIMGFCLYSLVIVFFNYGLLDRYITHRLALPIYLGFILFSVFAYEKSPREFLLTTLTVGAVISVITVIRYPIETFPPFLGQFLPLVIVSVISLVAALKIEKRRHAILLSFILLIIGIFSIPTARVHRYSQKYRSNDLVMAQIHFLEEAKKKEKVLWISSSPYPAIITETNYTPISKFGRAPELAKRHLTDRIQNSIYIAKVLKLNEEREWVLFQTEFDQIDEEIFKFELVREIPFEAGAILRIERLVDVNVPK